VDTLGNPQQQEDDLARNHAWLAGDYTFIAAMGTDGVAFLFERLAGCSVPDAKQVLQTLSSQKTVINIRLDVLVPLLWTDELFVPASHLILRGGPAAVPYIVSVCDTLIREQAELARLLRLISILQTMAAVDGLGDVLSKCEAVGLGSEGTPGHPLAQPVIEALESIGRPALPVLWHAVTRDNLAALLALERINQRDNAAVSQIELWCSWGHAFRYAIKYFNSWDGLLEEISRRGYECFDLLALTAAIQRRLEVWTASEDPSPSFMCEMVFALNWWTPPIPDISWILKTNGQFRNSVMDFFCDELSRDLRPPANGFRSHRPHVRLFMIRQLGESGYLKGVDVLAAELNRGGAFATGAALALIAIGTDVALSVVQSSKTSLHQNERIQSILQSVEDLIAQRALPLHYAEPLENTLKDWGCALSTQILERVARLPDCSTTHMEYDCNNDSYLVTEYARFSKSATIAQRELDRRGLGRPWTPNWTIHLDKKSIE